MPKKTVLALLRMYKKFLSSALPPACRYFPTCSEYMYDAVTLHGVFWGVLLGALRLLRCNPLFPGGADPVPLELGFNVLKPFWPFRKRVSTEFELEENHC